MKNNLIKAFKNGTIEYLWDFLEENNWFDGYYSNMDYRNMLLEWGTENGCLEIVKYAVEKGVGVDATQGSALRTSAINGHIDIVTFLVEEFPDCMNSHYFAGFELESFLSELGDQDNKEVLTYLQCQLKEKERVDLEKREIIEREKRDEKRVARIEFIRKYMAKELLSEDGEALRKVMGELLKGNDV